MDSGPECPRKVRKYFVFMLFLCMDSHLVGFLTGFLSAGRSRDTWRGSGQLVFVGTQSDTWKQTRGKEWHSNKAEVCCLGKEYCCIAGWFVLSIYTIINSSSARWTGLWADWQELTTSGSCPRVQAFFWFRVWEDMDRPMSCLSPGVLDYKRKLQTIKRLFVWGNMSGLSYVKSQI